MNLVLVRPLGSPPRMRGKVKACRLFTLAVGITPACAGKSPAIMVCSLEYWGSPPRVRGKDLVLRSKHLEIGITPAYAGKSCPLVSGFYLVGDHPRVCGEKDKAAEKAQHLRGSPPHVRGKDQACSRWRYPDGITPACAGKRPGWADSGCQRGDHPRVCGEKAMM